VAIRGLPETRWHVNGSWQHYQRVLDKPLTCCKLQQYIICPLLPRAQALEQSLGGPPHLRSSRGLSLLSAGSLETTAILPQTFILSNDEANPMFPSPPDLARQNLRSLLLRISLVGVTAVRFMARFGCPLLPRDGRFISAILERCTTGVHSSYNRV